GWANTNEKSASLRKNRPMKSCSFCIPVDNWGDFSASTLTSYPLLVMRKLPRGAAKLRQIFPGLVKRAGIAPTRTTSCQGTNLECLTFLVYDLPPILE
ncbi:MAG: hypothetical protein ACREPR_17035, partial [Brasilonema sp.]